MADHDRDDADALRRLQLLFWDQATRARALNASDPGAAAASSALLEVIRSEITRRLDDRLTRIRELGARAGQMPRAEFMAAYAELFGAKGTSKDELKQAMQDWVRRALPDADMQERVLQRMTGALSAKR